MNGEVKLKVSLGVDNMKTNILYVILGMEIVYLTTILGVYIAISLI